MGCESSGVGGNESNMPETVEVSLVGHEVEGAGDVEERCEDGRWMELGD